MEKLKRVIHFVVPKETEVLICGLQGKDGLMRVIFSWGGRMGLSPVEY